MTACGRCGGTGCYPTAASPHPAATSWVSSAGASCSLAPTRCESTSPWPTRQRRSRTPSPTLLRPSCKVGEGVLERRCLVDTLPDLAPAQLLPERLLVAEQGLEI